MTRRTFRQILATSLKTRRRDRPKELTRVLGNSINSKVNLLRSILLRLQLIPLFDSYLYLETISIQNTWNHHLFYRDRFTTRIIFQILCQMFRCELAQNIHICSQHIKYKGIIARQMRSKFLDMSFFHCDSEKPYTKTNETELQTKSETIVATMNKLYTSAANKESTPSSFNGLKTADEDLPTILLNTGSKRNSCFISLYKYVNNFVIKVFFGIPTTTKWIQ